MRKVFLDELPRWEDGRYKGDINWENSIGYELDFIYDDIKGNVKIVNYKDKKLYVKYNNKIIPIYRGSFQNGKIGIILGVINVNYKFNIGEIILGKYSKIKILQQIFVLSPHGERRKAYQYQCLNCGNIDVIDEYHLKEGKGCNVCCTPSKKVLKGYNDLWSTYPNIAKLLKHPQLGYTLSAGSNIKESFICPNCGAEINNKSINAIVQYGLTCHQCSDGISYPEKFVYNMLEQLNIKFEKGKLFKWLKNKIYDFYFEIKNEKYIIETHGIQHYEEHFFRINKMNSKRKIRTLTEEQENDTIKKNFAIKHGVQENNYIVIDCRYSDLMYIKNNIIHSELNNLFDLSKIDWLKCHEFACNSLVKVVCDLWENGTNNTKEISIIMKLARNTIIKYLNQGAKLNLCNYNGKLSMSNNGLKNGSSHGTKIICLNTLEIFNSIREAVQKYNLYYSGIGMCCAYKQKSAGKHPETGERLRWMYYKDYIEQLENKAS